MIVSFNWLKEYLNIDIDVAVTSEILTSTGLEVEGVTELFTAFDHLVVGKVIKCKSHPNADRLKITQVDVGSSVKQIVCGANNIDVGQYVVVVLVGNNLVNNKGDKIKIKKTKIRGEISEGMICAEDEIGLGDNHDGIIILDKNAKVGMLLSEHLGIQKDYAIEIGLTPNRTDAFGHIGVCRDLYAYHAHRKNKLNFVYPDVSTYKTSNKKLTIDLKVQNDIACPKYSGVCIQNVNIQASPKWLQYKLISIGLKPINNIVDITNFVLHETGHPLHAFDFNKIKDSKVIVRNAKKGEKIETLDSCVLELSVEDLVIADTEKPICLAGVIGGLNSAVDSHTKNIFLESAFFDPTFIRKTAKKHSINSESSYRFERGVDFNCSEFALHRAATLIRDLCQGVISTEVLFDSKKLTLSCIDFSFKNCSKILGFSISENEMVNILLDLGFEIISQTKDGVRLLAPSYRCDVNREIDVVEEIARIYGYDNLPPSNRISFQPLFDQKKSVYDLKKDISMILVADGFYEVQNNSLIPERISSVFNTSSKEIVKILNPLSQDLSILRPNMFYNGIETIRYNINRQNYNLKIFEFGHVYHVKDSDYVETQKLSLFCCGLTKFKNWQEGDKKVNFFYMKSILDKLLTHLGLDLNTLDVNSHHHSYVINEFEYSLKSQSIGRVGQFAIKTLKQLGVKKDIYFIDINLDLLLSLINNGHSISYQCTSKFPSISRDLSLLVDKSIPYAQIKDAINSHNSHFLTKFSLFDLYEGDKIDLDKKSFALNFLFQSEKKTLTDVEVDRDLYSIYQCLNTKFQITLREGELSAIS